MSEKDTFKSIAYLAFSDQSVGRLATAIEKDGFYTRDEFGRYMHVPPVGEEDLYSEIRNNVLKVLAQGYKADEHDFDYFYDHMTSPTLLNMSGWMESTLPDFEELQANWNNEHIGTTEAPTLPEPAPQSKVWDVLKGLLKMNYNKGIIDDLKADYSSMAAKICNDLKNQGVNITSKTLKNYIKLD